MTVQQIVPAVSEEDLKAAEAVVTDAEKIPEVKKVVTTVETDIKAVGKRGPVKATLNFLVGNQAAIASVVAACAGAFGLHLDSTQVVELVAGVAIVARWIES